MQKKRILCTSAALLAAISLIMPNQGYAKAKKPVLSKKKLTMSVGESQTLNVANPTPRVNWSAGAERGARAARRIRNRVIHQTIRQTRICRIKRKACRLHRFGF